MASLPTIPTTEKDQFKVNAVLKQAVDRLNAGTPDNSITNAMLEDMAEATVKGRAAGAGTGDPTDLSAAQVKTIIGLVNAAQSDQETGTSTTTYVTPGVQHFHQSAAKAWLRFNGTGTPAVAASYNFSSSVTDNGTGDYTVTYTVAFSSANYGISAFGGGASSSNVALIAGSTAAAPAAGSCRVRSTVSGGSTDIEVICLSFFGDFA